MSPSRYLGRTIARERFGVFWAVVSGLSWQAGAIAAPLLVKYAIDRGIVAHHRRALVFLPPGLTTVPVRQFAG